VNPKMNYDRCSGVISARPEVQEYAFIASFAFASARFQLRLSISAIYYIVMCPGFRDQ
jgi:hypothetical protein